MSETIATLTRADGSLKTQAAKYRDESGVWSAVTQAADP